MRHVVYHSPWPTFLALNLGSTGIVFVNAIHGKDDTYIDTTAIVTVLCAVLWWRDLCRESIAGYYTSIVCYTMIMGFILFIISEGCYFVALFWCYISNAMVPSMIAFPAPYIKLETSWLPVLGTLLLVGSSVSMTAAHHYYVASDRLRSITLCVLTVALGVIFVWLELMEFVYNRYDISDGIYGSIFYMLVGTHLMHVIIGCLSISVLAFRLNRLVLKTNDDTLMTSVSYYWHFVDIIWLIVYSTVYI